MAKKTNKKTINVDKILFNCRDILSSARNSGSLFEKRVSLFENYGIEALYE